MREEPIISGGVVKVALVLLVAGLLGVGAYAVAGGDIDLPDLPDLPEIETETTTEEQETATEDTVAEEPDGIDGPFTTASLADALEAVREDAGSVELTRVTINEVQTQLFVRRGDEVEAYGVRADSGELSTEEASVRISGDATLADFAFPIGGVRPAAVDRILAAARRSSGAEDFKPTVLTLERNVTFGSGELRWQLSAEGNGDFLTFRAGAEGRGLEQVGEGAGIPPAAQRARDLNECIQAAGDDTDAVLECLNQNG